MHIRGHTVLTWEQTMPSFKPAWDKGFTVERNLRGWRMEGMVPFKRNALWAKRADLLLRTSTGQSVILYTTPSFFGPPSSATMQVAPPADVALPAGLAPPAAVAPDPTPEDEDLPLVLGHVTERVQEAMDYVNKKHEIGQLTQEQLMAYLMRL